MEWLPLYQTDRDDPRMTLLARRLGLAPCYAFAHWVRFLQWASKYKLDGVIGDADEELAELGAEWPGPAGAFVEALRSVQLLDLLGQVDGWAKRVEYYVMFLHKVEARKEKERSGATQRKRNERARDEMMLKDAAVQTLRNEDAQPLNRTPDQPIIRTPDQPIIRTPAQPNTRSTDYPNNRSTAPKNVTDNRSINQQIEQSKEPTMPREAANVATCRDAIRAAETAVGSFSKTESKEPVTLRALRAVLTSFEITANDVERIVAVVKEHDANRDGRIRKDQLWRPVALLLYVRDRNLDTTKQAIRNAASYVLNAALSPTPAYWDRAEKLIDDAIAKALAA